jgi:hypothetical protein
MGLGGRRKGGGREGGGSHASSLRTLLSIWGLRIAEVADPATRIIVVRPPFLYVIIEPLLHLPRSPSPANAPSRRTPPGAGRRRERAPGPRTWRCSAGPAARPGSWEPAGAWPGTGSRAGRRTGARPSRPGCRRRRRRRRGGWGARSGRPRGPSGSSRGGSARRESVRGGGGAMHRERARLHMCASLCGRAHA